MKYYWNMGSSQLELLHQDRSKGFFEPFVVFQEGGSHASLDFISQLNKFLGSHFFRIFHKVNISNTLYKTFA